MDHEQTVVTEIDGDDLEFAAALVVADPEKAVSVGSRFDR